VSSASERDTHARYDFCGAFVQEQVT